MERIKRIKEFLNEWNTKTPYLRKLTQDIATDMRKEIADYELRQTANAYGYAATR